MHLPGHHRPLQSFCLARVVRAFWDLDSGTMLGLISIRKNLYRLLRRSLLCSWSTYHWPLEKHGLVLTFFGHSTHEPSNSCNILDTYSIKLPNNIPPTFRGRSLRFSYELVIGTCRTTNGVGGGPAVGSNSISRVMKVPIRVYNNVSGTSFQKFYFLSGTETDIPKYSWQSSATV